MRALVYRQANGQVECCSDYLRPTAALDEALIKVSRAGICSTDLEIIKGYVPGYKNVLGHEFVGRVEACPSRPELIGTRVVGEINCNCAKFTCADAVFQRNHAPERTVLGIINKDGALADYLTLPVENLHVVPDNLSDEHACFVEPLAAACRIGEQSVVKSTDNVAVIGDGKLGLLIAQVLVVESLGNVTLIGRHKDKMSLVEGLHNMIVADDVKASLEGKFDVVVEASGSASGISTALSLTRPLGTIVLKSTVSVTADKACPAWSELANDIVVNEKILVGSRCGPFDKAIKLLEDIRVQKLLDSMVTAVFPIEQGLKAIECAQSKGSLKVQLSFD